MKFKVEMSDENNETLTYEVEATNVFDAIDIVADLLEKPEETYLIKAEPIL